MLQDRQRLSLHTTVESFVPSAPVVYKPDISRINFLPDDFLSTVTEHFALDSDAANVLKAVKMKAKSDADFRLSQCYPYVLPSLKSALFPYSAVFCKQQQS